MKSNTKKIKLIFQRAVLEDLNSSELGSCTNTGNSSCSLSSNGSIITISDTSSGTIVLSSEGITSSDEVCNKTKWE